MTLHLGIQLSQSNAAWSELREHALLVEQLGYDSLWLPDHLMTFYRPDGPYLETWQLLAALAAITSRVRIGPLVTPVGFRHPAVLAKMATTLDHVSGGRAILGLGAGWFEAEYAAYGLPFGTAVERLARLEETAAIARALFDRPRASFDGRDYRLRDALAEPKPVQRRLPLLIGGSGERRMLRIAARYADLWNGFGAPDELAHKLEVLRRHCAEVGRDPAEIAPSVAFRPLIVRDAPSAIDARLDEIVARHQMPQRDTRYMVAGTVDEVAERLREYLEIGVRTFIVQMHAPYDRETLERLATEVRPRLLALVGA